MADVQPADCEPGSSSAAEQQQVNTARLIPSYSVYFAQSKLRSDVAIRTLAVPVSGMSSSSVKIHHHAASTHRAESARLLEACLMQHLGGPPHASATTPGLSAISQAPTAGVPATLLIVIVTSLALEGCLQLRVSVRQPLRSFTKGLPASCQATDGIKATDASLVQKMVQEVVQAACPNVPLSVSTVTNTAAAAAGGANRAGGADEVEVDGGDGAERQAAGPPGGSVALRLEPVCVEAGLAAGQTVAVEGLDGAGLEQGVEVVVTFWQQGRRAVERRRVAGAASTAGEIFRLTLPPLLDVAPLEVHLVAACPGREGALLAAATTMALPIAPAWEICAALRPLPGDPPGLADSLLCMLSDMAAAWKLMLLQQQAPRQRHLQAGTDLAGHLLTYAEQLELHATSVFLQQLRGGSFLPDRAAEALPAVAHNDHVPEAAGSDGDSQVSESAGMGSRRGSAGGGAGGHVLDSSATGVETGSRRASGGGVAGGQALDTSATSVEQGGALSEAAPAADSSSGAEAGLGAGAGSGSAAGIAMAVNPGGAGSRAASTNPIPPPATAPTPTSAPPPTASTSTPSPRPPSPQHAPAPATSSPAPSPCNHPHTPLPPCHSDLLAALTPPFLWAILLGLSPAPSPSPHPATPATLPLAALQCATITLPYLALSLAPAGLRRRRSSFSAAATLLRALLCLAAAACAPCTVAGTLAEGGTPAGRLLLIAGFCVPLADQASWRLHLRLSLCLGAPFLYALMSAVGRCSSPAPVVQLPVSPLCIAAMPLAATALAWAAQRWGRCCPRAAQGARAAGERKAKSD